MRLAEIWRFPVKSLQGERLEEASITERGIAGDRAWAIRDVESGRHLTARRMPELLMASARLVDQEVRITLPDQSETNDDAVLSKWLKRSVRLEPASDDAAGTYDSQADETETGEWFSWNGPEGSFHDSTRARISVVSTGALGSWDRRRFRINLIVERDVTDDADFVGRALTAGDAVIEIVKQIERCVMVTRPQPDHEVGPALERDLEVLRKINRDLGGCLGVGGPARSPGRLRTGDELSLR